MVQLRDCWPQTARAAPESGCTGSHAAPVTPPPSRHAHSPVWDLSRRRLRKSRFSLSRLMESLLRKPVRREPGRAAQASRRSVWHADSLHGTAGAGALEREAGCVPDGANRSEVLLPGQGIHRFEGGPAIALPGPAFADEVEAFRHAVADDQHGAARTWLADQAFPSRRPRTSARDISIIGLRTCAANPPFMAMRSSESTSQPEISTAGWLNPR